MWGKVSFASMFLIIFFWMAGIMTYSYAAENLLQNPGFEEKDGWNVWGQETWIKNINSAEEKHTGSWSFKVIIGDTKPWDSTIAEQIIKDMQPGDNLKASVWVMVPENTSLANIFVYLELFFIAQDGSELKKSQSIKYNNEALPQWEKLIISGVVPEGTKSIKYWLVIAPQKGENSGTVYFDDARFEIISSKRAL